MPLNTPSPISVHIHVPLWSEWVQEDVKFLESTAIFSCHLMKGIRQEICSWILYKVVWDRKHVTGLDIYSNHMAVQLILSLCTQSSQCCCCLRCQTSVKATLDLLLLWCWQTDFPNWCRLSLPPRQGWMQGWSSSKRRSIKVRRMLPLKLSRGQSMRSLTC